MILWWQKREICTGQDSLEDGKEVLLSKNPRIACFGIVPTPGLRSRRSTNHLRVPSHRALYHCMRLTSTCAYWKCGSRCPGWRQHRLRLQHFASFPHHCGGPQPALFATPTRRSRSTHGGARCQVRSESGWLRSAARLATSQSTAWHPRAPLYQSASPVQKKSGHSNPANLTTLKTTSSAPYPAQDGRSRGSNECLSNTVQFHYRFGW